MKVGELSIALPHGNKRLHLSVSLHSDDEDWEEWLLEDILSKAGAHPRAFWVHEMYMKRNTNGEFTRICLPFMNYPEKFFKYFQMTQTTFFYILRGIEECLTKHSNRPSISPIERLCVTLR